MNTLRQAVITGAALGLTFAVGVLCGYTAQIPPDWECYCLPIEQGLR